MWKYILKRLFFSIFTIVLTLTLLYVVSSMSMFRKFRVVDNYKDAFFMAWDAFKIYAKRVIMERDLGYSTLYRKDLVELIMAKIPVTLTINILAFLLYIPISITLGFISAYYKNTIIDRVIGYVTLILSSVPIYFWIFLVIVIVGYRLAWLPAQFSQGREGLWGDISIYIIPVSVLLIEPVAKFTRLIRTELIDGFNTDAIPLLKSKGLKKHQIMRRHLLKDSIIAIMPEFNWTFISTLVGCFFVESFYNIQGISNLLFDSLIRSYGMGKYVSIDVELFTAISLFYITYIAITGLLVDISYAWLDPRIHMGAKKTN